jgi:hypothetical protein
MSKGDAPYPGDLASPTDLLTLADEYRLAALALARLGRKGVPVSRAPYRMTAIHAVELYLSSLLLHAGHQAKDVRALQHDLAARTKLALGKGLVLKKGTATHLTAISASREYVVSRYGPEVTSTLSPVNRLAATLEEVAGKVRMVVAGPARTK